MVGKPTWEAHSAKGTAEHTEPESSPKEANQIEWHRGIVQRPELFKNANSVKAIEKEKVWRTILD